MLRKSLLAATCLAAITGPVSAASTTPEAAGAVSTHAAQALETEDMMRASALIGGTVRNGKGETIGTVDDLILNRRDRILYAVISVGGFLGVGEKLVAVSFEELKPGAKDVEGAIIYDRTKEQLMAQSAFAYAGETKPMTRERFMRSAERRIDLWQDRIDKGIKDAKDDAVRMKKGMSERVDGAWQKVKTEWAKLKDSSADAWQSARQNFDDAMRDLEKAWSDATS